MYESLSPELKKQVNEKRRAEKDIERSQTLLQEQAMLAARQEVAQTPNWKK
ncbi:hypothetical protein MVES_002484 [Malassezia vespertilionis]|uniref:Uncharacterized protein n=1 Tax=Malassezia vespertilionis TaxID=2020962 RepID=A0A2N1JAX4_9BASI|nr:hypothetical protein MVES_002484 [Malassezia vespertilionis]